MQSYLQECILVRALRCPSKNTELWCCCGPQTPRVGKLVVWCGGLKKQSLMVMVAAFQRSQVKLTSKRSSFQWFSLSPIQQFAGQTQHSPAACLTSSTFPQTTTPLLRIGRPLPNTQSALIYYSNASKQVYTQMEARSLTCFLYVHYFDSGPLSRELPPSL